ncbi:AraC-like DNA-binding protein [Streptomyces sp. V4I23]|uniref:helix-turn-helix domain-containing protein n=1 Tax=Streptomyces sp. V4I23 TaxID=3042282 RepID=UPI002782F5FE|nr:helix-turn-helix domain-containing protein [Streptomyces sp. V4I23]MDQ1012150.1 AraC-like DNA-binding protein [Streptomyces sp. V4I23]
MTTSAHDHPAAGSVDEWSDLIRRNFVALDIAPRLSDHFAGRVDNRALGHLSAAEVCSVPQTFTRSERLISQAPADLFQVGLLADGTGHLVQDSRACDLSPGDFAVYETARPFRWNLAGQWKLLVFTWDRDAIALDRSESEQLTARRLRGDTGITGVLSRTLADVINLDGDLPLASAVRFADELAALTVTAGLSQCESESPPIEDLTRQILRYIEENLADPDLDPHRIADHFFISTRTLHRLFARQGETVAHWIRNRRLEKCRHAVQTDRKSTISTIIARYGYFDLAVFSRAFTARYGLSPTAFRSRHN